MTACILCGGETRMRLDGVRDTRFGVPGTWAIHECTRCALVQTRPVPTQAVLKELYERHYNFGGEGGSGYGRAREKFLFSVLYRTWLALDGDISFHGERGSGRLLDIGCNEGRGLEIYRANGFAAEGLELNANAARIARARGFMVHECDLAELAPAAPYDRAVLSNVLEHMLDPRAMLAQLRRVLAPGGEVWISLPNVNSRFASLFGRDWINWHVPFHITHFSQDRLATLLRDAGFEVVAARQISPALWVAQSLLVWLGRTRPAERSLIRKRWLVAGLMLAIRGGMFPLLWLANRAGRGDCLVIKARRT